VLTTLARKGSFKNDVLKGNVPRSDLRVTIAGRPAPTPFGFGGSAQQLATGVRAAVDQLGKAPQR